MDNISIGGHFGISDGILIAIEDSIKIFDSDCIQIFAKSPMQYGVKHKLSDKDIYTFNKKYKNFKIFIHSSYLVNICNEKNVNKNLSLLKDDFNFLNKLEPHKDSGVVIHFGLNCDKFCMSKEKAITSMKSFLKELSKYTYGYNIILEVTCGKSKSDIIKNNDDIKLIFEKPMKICIDTAHNFISQNICTLESYKKYFEDFDKKIGLENIGLIHLNDCSVPYGSKKDKHCNLTKGYIFKDSDSLEYIYNLCKNNNIPIILETKSDYDKDVEVLKSSVKN